MLKVRPEHLVVSADSYSGGARQAKMTNGVPSVASCSRREAGFVRIYECRAEFRQDVRTFHG